MLAADVRVRHPPDVAGRPRCVEEQLLQIAVLDAVFAAHLLDEELGVRPELELADAQLRGAASPATSAEYSATLFVAVPIASPCASSTVPFSASRTNAYAAGPGFPREPPSVQSTAFTAPDSRGCRTRTGGAEVIEYGA